MTGTFEIRAVRYFIDTLNKSEIEFFALENEDAQNKRFENFPEVFMEDNEIYIVDRVQKLIIELEKLSDGKVKMINQTIIGQRG